MIEDLKQVRDALEALLNYQQADIDGVMVLTSRQAIHEVSDYVRAALDRIIAEATPSTDALKILRHVNNWSEIETAPKDGTEILLGRFEDGVIEDVIKDYWYEDRVMAAWAEYPAVFDNSPTHWARLPLLLGCSAPNAQPEKVIDWAGLDKIRKSATGKTLDQLNAWSYANDTRKAGDNAPTFWR